MKRGLAGQQAAGEDPNQSLVSLSRMVKLPGHRCLTSPRSYPLSYQFRRAATDRGRSRRISSLSDASRPWAVQLPAGAGSPKHGRFRA